MTDSIQAYIALGCNLGDRMANLSSALKALEEHPDCVAVECSSVYETDPMGPQDQPDYLNAVVGLQTQLSALNLLDELQNIENLHGRVRDGERWGARTLDLDLLLYSDSVIDTPVLSVPHPGISERSFVLLPLAELAPDLIVPNKGSVSILLSQCRRFGIRRLNSTL